MSPAVPEQLRAKSAHGGRPPLRLDQHLRDTDQAATALFRPGSRWAEAWRRFFKLSAADAERFLLNLRVAALFHDLGKANADFYAATAGGKFLQQAIRHEHLSALVLQLDEVRGWLAMNPALEHAVVSAAVLSHHIKADGGGDWKWCQPLGPLPLLLYLRHAEVQSALDEVARIAKLAPPPVLPDCPFTDAEPWTTAHARGMTLAREVGRMLRRDPSLQRRLVAVKAGLIAADSVASGIVRVGESIEQWLEAVAHAPAFAYDDLQRDIIGPRTQSLSKSGRPFSYHEFQLGAARAGSRALLLAACGAGKTLAAWKWAEAQAREKPIGRVIFLYPTRGTATEGFRDYVAWAPETKAALVHGTATYELAAMAGNPSEAMGDKDFALDEQHARLFALGLWPRRYFSATVDRFLAFLEHGYESLCLLPALADAVVIIDEVHSFDRHMFDLLVAFLKNFDVPVLCMTATLPRSRRQELEQAGLHVYPEATDTAQLRDLAEQENHPRYRIARLHAEDLAFQRAVAAYHEGERVLWVVNVVSRCQSLVQRLQQELGTRVLCYHSRFRLQDRKDRHAETVAAFQQLDRPAIAVTTQVCEMSLDLDADVLLTEEAPVTSLVQRFGRANRHRKRGDSFRAEIGIYPPPAPLPYEKNDFVTAGVFLNRFTGEDASQRALADALEELARAERKAEGSAPFLTMGLFAVPGFFRDGDDFAEPCILDADLEAYLQARSNGALHEGYVLSVPRRGLLPPLEDPPREFPRYLRLASAQRYDPELGFLMETQTA